MENFQKMWLLLDVMHKAVAGGPAYSWIIAMADAELDKTRVDMTTPAKNMAMEHPELKKFGAPESPTTLVTTPMGDTHG